MLQISNVTLDAYGRRFLDDASVVLPPGAKAGLVGRNGIGKSTLFKAILGELQPNSGEILFPKNWRIATVDQEIAASPILLIDAVLQMDRRRETLLQALEQAPPEKLGEIHADLIAIGADRAPARAAEILSGLGFATEDLTRPISSFSGGWRMRAALAGALLAEPDLLLLDEPTNYLDLEGALWLEARLARYPNAALIISHDRELLNAAVDRIFHLEGKRLTVYTGGYDRFETQKAEKAALEQAQAQKTAAERAHLQAFVDRFRAKASKAKQAQSRMKRLEKLPPSSTSLSQSVAPFILPSPPSKLAPPLVRIEGANVGYDGKIILRNLNLRLDLEDRIGLLGVNGAGKSTFAKLLADAVTVQSGEFWKDRRLKVGWFHQHQIEALDPTDTPIEIMRRARPDDTEAKRRARLGSFGITAEKAETTCAELSGGERARLLLNMVAMDAPHLLILDEPTNHLDIDSRRALLEALNDYEGAVLIITHDRSLMELVADRLWLAADGEITPFEGDMDEYAQYVLDRRRTENAKTDKSGGGSSKEARKAAAAARAKLAPLKKTVQTHESEIEKLNRELQKIDAMLAYPEAFGGDSAAQAVKLSKDRAALVKRVEAAEAAWLEAAEIYETAKAASEAADA